MVVLGDHRFLRPNLLHHHRVRAVCVRDILFLAKDRRTFTEMTFGWLLENTNWDLVNRLIVYDDGSTDGTREWLRDIVRSCPQEHYLRETHFGSPVAVMNDYLDKTDADWFCKVDNDICLPTGWLEAMTSVIDNYDLDLLGMEAGMSGPPEDHWDGVYRPNMDCTHIGGVGMMRVGAIKRYPRPVPNGRFGFTESQHKFKRKSAWISPDLRMSCLDKIPEEPYLSLTEEYLSQGDAVQRKVGSPYPPQMADYHWGWLS